MGSKIPSIDAWARARDRYREDLTEDEKQIYSTATLENLYYDASAAEKTHRATSSSRAFVSKLQPLCAAIEQYGEALDTFANASALILCPLWGSVRVVLHLAREFGKYFDKLVEMFARIGDVLPRFRVYEKLFPGHEQLVQSLSIVYLDIIKFCTDAKAVFRQGRRPFLTNFKAGFKLLWKPFDRQFGQRMDDFRIHRKNVDKEAALSHMVEAADARAVDIINRLQVNKEREDNERRRILAMLSSLKYDEKQRKCQRVRYEDTGQWLLDNLVFQGWRTSNESSSLCCYGIPGCGKTVLTSKVVDTLLSTLGVNGEAVVYFYCDYADHRTLDTCTIFGTILLQLLRAKPIPEPLMAMIRNGYEDGLRTPETKDLIAMICAAVELFPQSFIIIDGLDECKKNVWQDILVLIKDLIQKRTPCVKIFVSCREEDQIMQGLSQYSQIQISTEVVSSDISAFIQGTVRSRLDSGELRIHNPILEKNITHKLEEKAQGMFLWVSFQLDDLCEASSDAIIRKILDDLPHGLVETYQRILTKIHKSSIRSDLARRIFKWAACACRPLSIEEMREAIAFDADDKCWDVEKIPDEKVIIRSCGNLITLGDDGETVCFAHHTVQQFLLSDQWRPSDSTNEYDFHFTLEEAQSMAANTCLAYLSFTDFETQIRVRPLETKIHNSQAVLGKDGPSNIASVLGLGSKIYAIAYRLWGGNPKGQATQIDYSQYLKRKAAKAPDPDLTEKYHLLNYVIENWLRHTMGDLTEVDAINASFGVKSWAQFYHLATDKNLLFDIRPWRSVAGSQDLPYKGLFDWAIEEGHVALLSILKDPPRGEELLSYIRDCTRKSPPWLTACRRGHAGVLYCLQKWAPEWDWLNRENSRLMAIAAAEGHTAVVDVLIRLGADMDAEVDGYTALQWAAVGGHQFVAKTLLDHGASRSWEGRASPIHLAVDNCQAAVIYTLIQNGIDPMTRDRKGMNALHIAVELDDESAVLALLNFSIPELINAKCSIGGMTALHLAIRDGQMSILRTLLREGADLEMTCDTGMNALHLAIEYERDEIVKMLLKEGARPESRNKLGSTALHMAAKIGSEDMTRALLQNGADVEAQDSDRGYSALHIATNFQHPRVVKMLIDFGASTRARVGQTELGPNTWINTILTVGGSHMALDLGCTALCLAAKNGAGAVVTALLDGGADIDTVSGSQKLTALRYAVMIGHKEVVQILLTRAASTSAQDREQQLGQMEEAHFTNLDA